MAALLPPNLLKLFAPRPPTKYWEPLDREPSKRIGPHFSNVASYTTLLKEANENDTAIETRQDEKKIKKELKAKEVKQKIEEELKNSSGNPKEDESIKSDPYRTLFVARLNYETTESKLMKEFERFGSIDSIKLVRDKSNKSRGYAFIEFKREKDLKYAYREADGLRIDGKRIIVDVERGRTVKSWKPRRLGGGLGSLRMRDVKDDSRKNSSISISTKRTRSRSRSRSNERHKR